MERKKVKLEQCDRWATTHRHRLLEVELSDGSIWQYSKVPGEVHRRFLAAHSMVSYYRDNIEEDYSRRRIK